ncbi:MAG: hypothetical protein RLO48_07245 [Bauldia litoralis]
MKVFAIALLALVSIAAGSPAQEQDYLASRDAFVARFTAEAAAGNFGDEVMAAHQEALDELEAQLRDLIGPVTLDGFSSEGAVSLETLFDGDLGFGLLDGLTFGMDDGSAGALVTTKGIVDAWLVEHRDWWGTPAMPGDLRDALETGAFYTQAISADAAVARFAEIPVTPPAGADFAYAMLDLRSQDVAIGVPDEIIAVVLANGRFTLASAPVTSPVTAIADCDAVWQDYEAQAMALSESDQDAGADDDSRFDEIGRIYAEGEAAFHTCYGERVDDQDFYPGLVDEAQALVDRLKTL